ncbi:MAG TPA: ATP-binding protein, partial [Noviherbaspirillum sp.]|nr:ATP-binding protein [Noviherbaspirillum sp.]
GELSLSGELRPIRGALAMTYAMHRAGDASGKERSFILPRANADEAALVQDAAIVPADSLLQVCAHFAATDSEARLARHQARAAAARPAYPDFADVKGQAQAKRALEVAAAGGHSVLMVGPPGTGKSMLAARFPGILPPMTDEEALESAAVQSLTSGFTISKWKARPFRAPHHTASGVALVGGGVRLLRKDKIIHLKFGLLAKMQVWRNPIPHGLIPSPTTICYIRSTGVANCLIQSRKSSRREYGIGYNTSTITESRFLIHPSWKSRNPSVTSP